VDLETGKMKHRDEILEILNLMISKIVFFK